MRWICMTLVLATALVCVACRAHARPRSSASSPRPQPRTDMAGESRARRVGGVRDLPGGAGIEGREGDIVIENGLARFVVASAERSALGGPGGNVLDAAPHGGGDTLRLVRPLLGENPPRPPFYVHVGVRSAGGRGRSAVVEAAGYLAGDPRVEVATTYTLQPDTYALAVETTVTNRRGDALRGFAFRDEINSGRSLRYAPEGGLYFRGKSPPARWVSFLGPRNAWGMLSQDGEHMTGWHDAGGCVLLHRRATIPAGGSASWRRRLVAGPSGHEHVWLAAYPGTGDYSRLHLTAKDADTGEPVAGALVGLAPRGSGSPVVAETDHAGRAVLDLPPGSYQLAVRAAGRPIWGPVTVHCSRGDSLFRPVPLAPAARALVTVAGRIGTLSGPVAARLVTVPVGRGAAYPRYVPSFPDPAGTGVVLAEGRRPVQVPLAPASERGSAAYLVILSKGPLFECQLAPVRAASGETLKLAGRLNRVIEPGEYIGIDMRQYAQPSPDCALTWQERALTNECEGLDAAVVSDPPHTAPEWGEPGEGLRVPLLPGVRLHLDGVGAFSVYPARAAQVDMAVLATALHSAGADGLLKAIRSQFPKALIQLDAPLDDRLGYFALTDPDRWAAGQPPPGASLEFDALEILSGRDVDSARRMLPIWFALLNRGRRVIATGGSGSRATLEEEAGVARTFVRCPEAGDGLSAAEAVEALRRLRTRGADAFVTNGPFIEASLNGKPIGSRQRVPGPNATLKLSVRAAPWVDVSSIVVYRSGQPVYRAEVPSETKAIRYSGQVPVDIPGDCWLVITVEGERPMKALYGDRDAPRPFAVTNPFFVQKP